MTHIIKIDSGTQIMIKAIEAFDKFKYWAITDNHGNILKHFASYTEMYESFFKDFKGNQELNLSYITKGSTPDTYGVDPAPYQKKANALS